MLAGARESAPAFLSQSQLEARTVLSEPGQGTSGVPGETAIRPQARRSLIADKRLIGDPDCLAD